MAEFVRAFTVEWNQLRATASASQEMLRRDLATTERKLAGLINALAEGFRAPGLQDELDALTARKDALSRQLAKPEPTPPSLHRKRPASAPCPGAGRCSSISAWARAMSM